jgi:transposase
VAYAAERSATAQCLDAAGRVVAYAKVHDEVAAEARLTRAVGRALAADDAARTSPSPAGTHPTRTSPAVGAASSAWPYLRVPQVLAADGELLRLEALSGRRLDRGGALEPLGAALGALHSLPLPAERFDRLDPLHLETAALVVAQARPDLAGPADRLLGRLTAAAADAEREHVCLHGDANLRNALLLDDGRVGLIDLEHVCAGPAAADLGQLLAGMLVARAQGASTAGAAPLLAGYARTAPPPDRAALRWFTAASVLARIALPAIGRVRPDTLAHLRALLCAGADLVTPTRYFAGAAR